MTIVAHAHPFVVGVDTHACNHALAVLAALPRRAKAAAGNPARQNGAKRESSKSIPLTWLQIATPLRRTLPTARRNSVATRSGSCNGMLARGQKWFG